MAALQLPGKSVPLAVWAVLGVFALLGASLVAVPVASGRWRLAALVPQSDRLITLRKQYIATVRDSLAGVHLQTPSVIPGLHQNDSELQHRPYSEQWRSEGEDWPLYGLTMVGIKRLNNLWTVLESVLERSIPGSFVECGVWRGGASIFAKAVLVAHGASEREVHLVDSFQGLPPNTTTRDQLYWSEMSYLRVSQPEVQAAFERFGLLDRNVFFHKGYFRYALSAWRAQGIGPIAVLRMDGDMYESTMDQLYLMWDAISPGGYVIIDDWKIKECQTAVQEFFGRNNLSYKIHPIDTTSAYFQKTDASPIDMGWYIAFNASRSTADAGGADG